MSPVQTFAENPYFSEKTLTKSYALHSEGAAEKKPTTAEEIEDALAAFDPEEELEPRATPITWKSDATNLIKLQPREIPTLDEDTPIEDMQMEGDMGSFFHFFTEAEDPMDVRISRIPGCGACVLIPSIRSEVKSHVIFSRKPCPTSLASVRVPPFRPRAHADCPL